MNPNHPHGLEKRKAQRYLALLSVALVTCFSVVELASFTPVVAAKPKPQDDQALLDAAEQLKLRDLPTARKTLQPLCPGDLQDAIRGAKKGEIPCSLITVAETEARGTRPADKLSLLYWNVADDARKREQFALAKSLYTVAIDRNPNDPENWYWLGMVERDLGRFPDSRQALTRALELEPGHRDALYWTATDLMDEGKYDESTDLLDRLLATDPKDGRAWYRRGEVLSHQGKCPEATVNLEKARVLGVDSKKISKQIKECTSAGS